MPPNEKKPRLVTIADSHGRYLAIKSADDLRLGMEVLCDDGSERWILCEVMSVDHDLKIAVAESQGSIWALSYEEGRWVVSGHGCKQPEPVVTVTKVAHA